MSGPPRHRVECAYHELWHQLFGQKILRAAAPPLQTLLYPLPWPLAPGIGDSDVDNAGDE